VNVQLAAIRKLASEAVAATKSGDYYARASCRLVLVTARGARRWHADCQATAAQLLLKKNGDRRYKTVQSRNGKNTVRKVIEVSADGRR
jgi:hypothetical protein